jgi:diaminopimelate epimerase
MNLDFTKMHGLGNDFIVIDDRDMTLDLSPEAVAWLCDRNFGIGADGLMLVRPATVDSADFGWWFRNADGSVAEMCGNGIRCFAKFVFDRGLIGPSRDSVSVETDVGVLSVGVERDADGLVASAIVDMGEPRLIPTDIPTTLRCEGDDSPVISCPLNTDAGTFEVTMVSMGNPHCVIFVKDVDDAPVTTVGPIIETHPSFPNKTNVEFAQVLGGNVIRLRVWERGVGETLACGTGACATAVAAALTCRGGRDALIELPGGELTIRWAENGHVMMTGSASTVFIGTLEIPEDDE